MFHEHATRPEQPMYHHLCFNDQALSCVSFKYHIFNVVHNNFEIIVSNYNLSNFDLKKNRNSLYVGFGDIEHKMNKDEVVKFTQLFPVRV